MADTTNKLVGQNYQTPDIVAKVTGQAKYAEDFRAEGMLFTKLLLSPMPHARVRNIDASAALAMPGVHAILTEEDCPDPSGEGMATGASNIKPFMVLTNEPLYQGEPILAVVADDELTAAEAIERIQVDLEPLPFVVDPIEAMRPGSDNPREQGNVWVGNQVESIKWTDEEWREVEEGRLPFREAPDTWEVGNVEAGFEEADLIVDETLVSPSTNHDCMEPRSTMAYWQNGKLYLHTSTQSISRVVPTLARYVGIPPSDLIMIAEYCGGGFGSKASGASSAAIPALLARKTGRPVMMRISREEEQQLGTARSGLHARAKIGFRRDGRITAMDLFIVQDNGPFRKRGDGQSCARGATVNYTPPNFRVRAVVVLTNTPPRAAQRGPGGVQQALLLEPLISKAARQLGIDEVEIRKINAASTGDEFGRLRLDGTRARLSSARVREALDIGAERFNWAERIQRSGQRRGNIITGVGVALGNYSGGSEGYDGLMTLRPDGRLYIQQGVGNLGTLSTFDTARAAPEVLGFPWEKVEITWGNTSRHLPWSCGQGGSQTTHAHTRANHAAAMDLKRKLQEIAAMDLGGRPEDYEVAAERVYRRGNRGRGLTVAQAAERAIALGGKFDGHELPEDINPVTTAAATALVGLGVMGVAKDNYGRKDPRNGTKSFMASFAEVQVDVETGRYRLVDYLGVADCGTVLHPHSLEGQIHGGAVQGFGQVIGQKWVYDPQFGVALATRFYETKPLSILDVPLEMDWDAVDLPDEDNPVGAKGVGEVAMCAGAAALRCALAAAVGDDLLRRTPITQDMILGSLEAGRRVDGGLVAHV